MRLPTVVVLSALVALAAGPAFARSTFPGQLDAACRAGGRTPPNPAALARATGVPLADCALCHTFSGNGFPSGGNVNTKGMAYKRGSLDPFCVLAPVNHAPVLAPIGNQTVNVGQPLGLLLSASDADNDVLAFSATGLPNGAVFMDAGNGMATFNWTPPQAGNTAITFMVTDGTATDSERVVITAGTVNAPPVLAPIGDQTAMVGNTLTVTITATDPEGGPLTFAAMGLPAGATLQDFGDGSADLVFTPTMAVQASVTVRVTDAGTPPETAAETFMLTGVDPTASGGPALEYATWNGWEGLLALKGNGAPPDSLVSIVDPTTEAVLATAQAGSNGSFRLAARPFLAPCLVRARNADGVLGDPIGVMMAPQDCGKQLQTTAKPRWRCKDNFLSVRGSRAPVSSNLSLVDAANNAVLATGQSDSRGRFSLSATTGSHANVRLLFSSGTGSWMLGPIPVQGADLICDRKDNQD